QAVSEGLVSMGGSLLEVSPPPTNPVGSPPLLQNTPASTNPSPLLKHILEQSLPIPEQRSDFVDRSLSASDNAMAHASALAKLAERYDAIGESVLTPNSQARLREMLRVHLERLELADAELDPLIHLLPA